MDKKLKNSIIDIVENDYEFLKNLENVNGIGLGFKTINGYVTDELCIHVLVEKKLEKSLIVNSENIIPKTYMGLKTDVLEVGTAKFRGFTEKVRPLQSGYSMSPSPDEIAGTLSGIVVRIQPCGKKIFYVLGNNHVLSSFGETPLNTPVLQPGKQDGGTDEDVIAFVSDSIPINSSLTKPYPINYVDAALAKLKDPSLISTLVASLGHIKGVANPVLNSVVKKSGRTSGVTEGKITTINATIDIQNSTFKKQIIANITTLPGDSGSLLLNENNNVVGLLFSGDDEDYGISYANPIKLVLEALKVKLLIFCE